MNRDLQSNILAVESIRPQVAAGAVNGEGVNLQGFSSAAVVVSVGAITGVAGDATIILEESDDNVTFAAVAAGDIQGTQPTLAANTAYQFGYSGSKQYVRPVFALGGETNVAVSSMVIAGNAHRKPTV